MNEGKIVSEVEGDDINSEKIMYFASGAYRMDNKSALKHNGVIQ
jgi:hypothetical protein